MRLVDDAYISELLQKDVAQDWPRVKHDGWEWFEIDGEEIFCSMWTDLETGEKLYKKECQTITAFDGCITCDLVNDVRHVLDRDGECMVYWIDIDYEEADEVGGYLANVLGCKKVTQYQNYTAYKREV